MPQHFTKNVVEAQIFSPRWMAMTSWKIEDGRRQYCLTCYDRRLKQDQEAPQQAPETQGKLF